MTLAPFSVQIFETALLFTTKNKEIQRMCRKTPKKVDVIKKVVPLIVEMHKDQIFALYILWKSKQQLGFLPKIIDKNLKKLYNMTVDNW